MTAIVPEPTSTADRDGLVEMAWGPHHPNRRQSGHLHQDRLRQSRSGGVPQHVVDFSWVFPVHEGEGPARRAFHHQSYLRHLR